MPYPRRELAASPAFCQRTRPTTPRATPASVLRGPPCEAASREKENFAPLDSFPSPFTRRTFVLLAVVGIATRFFLRFAFKEQPLIRMVVAFWAITIQSAPEQSKRPTGRWLTRGLD